MSALLPSLNPPNVNEWQNCFTIPYIPNLLHIFSTTLFSRSCWWIICIQCVCACVKLTPSATLQLVWSAFTLLSLSMVIQTSYVSYCASALQLRDSSQGYHYFCCNSFEHVGPTDGPASVNGSGRYLLSFYMVHTRNSKHITTNSNISTNNL
jgi:hypothetical protein